MRLSFIALSAVLALAACTERDSEPEPIPTLEPPALGEGFQMSMQYTVEPHSEAWICSVYPIPTAGVSPVNSIEYIQNPGMHHMTLSTPGLVPLDLDYGMHDCATLYDQAMDSLTMMFGSQGASSDTMNLPEGVAAELPEGIDIVHEVHYVNTSDEPVVLYSYVNAYTIPQEEVVEGIWGGQVRDENIFIPAESEHSEWTRCLMNTDVEVLFLASHTHDLGIEFTVAPFDGTETGEVFYRNTDLHDPMIVQYDPPMQVSEGQGFEYHCTWRNDSSSEVTYGTSAFDEMCNLAIVHMPFDITAKCQVVETSDGVLWE